MALSEVGAAAADLPSADRAHLERLVSEWAMLADFSFSDLLLYVPSPGSGAFVIVAHIRPATAQTIYHSDVVGERRVAAQRPLIAEAAATGEMATGEVDSTWLGDRIRVTAIPLRRAGRVIAVLARESPQSIRRYPGELELTYQRVFADFARMIAEGVFPYPVETGEVTTYVPRVGDGVLVVDAERRISYASPNARSALIRAGAVGALAGRGVDETDVLPPALARAVRLGRPTGGEIEVGEICLAVRTLPLRREGRLVGSVVLVREVTDLRRRDQLLVSKDATIREIHHRVKNNLQTISSLLRLQGRRLTEPSAKVAIEESVRRIRSIAIVHEILSRDTGDDVALIDVLRPLVRMVEDGLVDGDRPIEFVISGEPGVVPSPVATALAVVLTELLQNVVEHAYPPEDDLRRRPGHVELGFTNDGSHLGATVVDDGVGLPAAFDLESSPSLGLSIVRNLVTSELGGQIDVVSGDPTAPGNGADAGGPGDPHRVGTAVTLSVPFGEGRPDAT